jgi:hypothetical protein
VANNTAHCRAYTGTRQPAAQDIANYCTGTGTDGCTFFLLRHAGTATESHCGCEKNSRQISGNTFELVHGKSPDQVESV